MKRSILFLASGGAAALLLMSNFASAQTSCREADANNATVKQTCTTGRIVEGKDSLGCTWLKCDTSSQSSSSSSADVCADAKQNNLTVQASCKGQIVRKWDEKKCEWWSCVTETQTGDVCAEAKKSNLNVQATCKGNIMRKWDENKCEWWRCEQAVPSVGVDCKELWAKMQKLPIGSADYNALRKKYNEQCTQPTTTPVTCKKYGCDVKCEDGTSFNVCQNQCSTTSNNGTTDSNPTGSSCSRRREGKCMILTCGTKVEKKCTQ